MHPATSSDQTILVVEDDQDVHRLLVDVLENAGFKTVEARDGRSALAAYQSHDGAIDAIVTDVIMPVMGGERLAKELDALGSTAYVLFVSGSADLDSMPKEVSGRRTAFLQKPFRPAELVHSLRELLAAR